jgi:hypothetical protein
VVLRTRQPLHHEFLPLRMPLHARQVGLPRVARRLHPDRVPTLRRNHADAARGVRGTRLWILHGHNLAVTIGEVVDHQELADARAVELPVRKGLAVGAPTEPIAAIKLLFVDPVERAVDDRRRAVLGQPRLRPGRHILDVEVVLRGVGDACAVRRPLGKHQRRLRQRATETLRFARPIERQHVVLTARVLPPDLLTVREYEQLRLPSGENW